MIAHVITHSIHHRAQVMYILEQVGVQNVLEGDALGWEGQARGWGYSWSNSGGITVADRQLLTLNQLAAIRHYVISDLPSNSASVFLVSAALVLAAFLVKEGREAVTGERPRVPR